MSAMVVQGVTVGERAMDEVSEIQAAHARLDQQRERTADHEQRIKDLESQARSLATVTEHLSRQLSTSLSHWVQRVQALEDQTSDEGVVTLRITAERGGR